MPNVSAATSPITSELAVLVRHNLDALATYATHLVGDPDDGVDFTAGGLAHAAKYPPARLSRDGRASLYRAVTRACRQGHRYPGSGGGISALFRRRRSPWQPELLGAETAARINTVKRALATLSFERRAALLLRGLAGLSYREMGTALECSPDAAAKLLAAARREFGSIYREIAL